MGKAVVDPVVYCKCGCELREESGLALELRTACPVCGSKNRLHKVEMNEELRLAGHLGIRFRHPGKGKWKVQRHEGDSFYSKTRVWHTLSRLLDRVNDWYSEKIVDENGKVIREVNEPLSKHTGRGSAKHKT